MFAGKAPSGLCDVELSRGRVCSLAGCAKLRYSSSSSSTFYYLSCYDSFQFGGLRAAIKSASNVFFKSSTEHLDVRCHFLKEKGERGNIVSMVETKIWKRLVAGACNSV